MTLNTRREPNNQNARKTGDIQMNNPSQQDISTVEERFQPVEELFRTARELSEKIEDEEIDRDDPDGYALNFLVDEGRYEALKNIWERWENGSNDTLADVDMDGLYGCDLDDLDLKYDADAKVDLEFFEVYTSDFRAMFEDAIEGLTYCIENR
jgi:hypothetical protein